MTAITDITDKPKIHLIQEEILRILGINESPMTASDLSTLCEHHDEPNQIHKAIGILMRNGLIQVAGTTEGRRGSIARRYRLAPKIEADEADEPSEADAAVVVEPGTDRPPSSATGSNAGDEFERAVYLAPAECAQGGKSAEALRFAGDQPHCADPILSAIERIDEPHLLHGATHARRLRALADQAVIARQIDVRAWLYDLATLLEESA